MNKSNNGKHQTPPLEDGAADHLDDPGSKADTSSRWFAYIAVGITLVAMVVGLAVMGRIVFLFFRG